ncbi:MAG TPA: TadE/TadG family type IV pilus assembly protein [Candidatus Binatia bacterium]
MMAIYKTAKAFVRRLCGGFDAFSADERGNVAIIFGLALLPIMTAVGAAVDYSRANAAKSSVQSALDAGLLAGALDGTSNWKTVATNVYNSNLKSKKISTAEPPTFTAPAASTFAGSAKASITASILGVIGYKKLDVVANATAMAAEADNSCILTLDKGQPASHVSLKLNGAPVINLSGCTIRSNTSLDCNGHDGNVTKSFASGSAIGCGKPTSNAPVVPDIYKDMAKNITQVCAGARPGVTWTPGTLPTGAGFKTITNAAGITEHHICGDMHVSGNGSLSGVAPASDVVIVIENGSLIVDDKSSITTTRTTIVMTGNNNWPAHVDFPQGNGKVASLALSPSTSALNPWQGVALFLDPLLTKDVDNKWGPGADFDADGLVYLGNSNVVTDGNTSSANSKCTKFVMNQFTTNGSVKLDFAQQNCAALGLKQWGGIVVHLTK